MMGGAALGVVVFPHPPPQLPCLLHHVLLCPPGPMVQVFITNACAAIRICSWCSDCGDMFFVETNFCL